MFKKLIRRLTQSEDDRYQHAFEQFATSLHVQGSPHLANLARAFAKLKQSIDQRIDARDPFAVNIDDFDQLTLTICDGVRAKLTQLAQLDKALPEVLQSREPEQLKQHTAEWKHMNESIMRAYALLHRAATDERSNIELFPASSERTAMYEALETLNLQVRTADRIRDELGG